MSIVSHQRWTILEPKPIRDVEKFFSTTQLQCTGEDIMSFTVNLKIDNNLTGYNNQQQITGPRTV